MESGMVRRPRKPVWFEGRKGPLPEKRMCELFAGLGARRARVVRESLAGGSLREVASVLGVSHQTVANDLDVVAGSVGIERGRFRALVAGVVEEDRLERAERLRSREFHAGFRTGAVFGMRCGVA